MIFAELVIREVRKHPELYNMKLKDYKSPDEKRRIFMTITEEINKDIEEKITSNLIKKMYSLIIYKVGNSKICIFY